MKKIFTIVALLISYSWLNAQGTLMLVGGGTERSGESAWNFEPYSKAVDLSANKRVAIVAFAAEDDTWLADYFVETAGAVEAIHIDFSAIDVANYGQMYDSLMAFDMIFFKGGDQNEYYENFNGTVVETALVDKYLQGGVLAGTSAGMAILSSIIYTAENGTVYPDEAINNPLNSYMTLADDFGDFMPGYLFDTHFAERGRFARLVGLMANRFLTQNAERITGLGIDDLTVAIIRNDSVYVYGTGAGNFYFSENAYFGNQQTMLQADSVRASQLLNGCTFDVQTGEIDGFSSYSTPILTGEGGYYTLLLSGGIYGNYHTEMMEVLVNDCGAVDGSVVIVAPSASANVASLVAAIENVSDVDVFVLDPISGNGQNVDVQNALTNAQKFVFVDNTYQSIMSFMGTTQNGQLLNQKIRLHNAVVAFVGDNSRFAGHTVVNGYEISGASYYAELTFDEGFDLLKTTVVMPNTYANNDIFENTATAVPYAMLHDNLTFGMWLNKKNFVKYSMRNDSTWIDAFGDSPGMIIKNNGTAYDYSITPNVGSNTPRMIAGFEQMWLTLLDGSKSYLMGTEPGLGVEATHFESNMLVYPNPAVNQVFVACDETHLLEIYEMNGQIIERFSGNSCYVVNTSNYVPGVYLVKAIGIKQTDAVRLIVQ